jgi:hypothetical protein
VKSLDLRFRFKHVLRPTLQCAQSTPEDPLRAVSNFCDDPHMGILADASLLRGGRAWLTSFADSISILPLCYVLWQSLEFGQMFIFFLAMAYILQALFLMVYTLPMSKALEELETHRSQIKNKVSSPGATMMMMMMMRRRRRRRRRRMMMMMMMV